MKTRNYLLGLTVCAVLGSVAGCSKKADSGSSTPPAAGAPAAATPAPTSSQPMQDLQFQRVINAATGLIARKDFKAAQEALAQTENYRLTPDQQAKVADLRAQIK